MTPAAISYSSIRSNRRSVNLEKFNSKRPASLIVRLGRCDAVRRNWSELKMKPAKALAATAAAGNLKTMRAMLNEDNAIATDWKPIMDACYIGQADAVALLLEHGADPNVKSKLGATTTAPFTARWSTRRQRPSTTVITRWSICCSMPALIH